MASVGQSRKPVVPVDVSAQPFWMRTGYEHFPYAAKQSDQWWVLRMNFGFPEHDMYTLFINREAAVDIPSDPHHTAALVRGIAALSTLPPALDVNTAAAVVGKVACYANYGSELGDPCDFCSHDGAGLARV